VRQRIRVLEPGFFQVWELRKTNKRKEEWVIIDQGETDLPFVPIITYYATRDAFLMTKPPLDDLAFLNIRHWQSMSDQINVLTVARFPMLAVAGATDTTGSTMRIGPRTLLATKDANGRFYYVEHTGASIKSGWDELSKLEDDMQAYGATFLKKRPDRETAKAATIENVDAASPLQDMVIRFIDTVNGALRIHATWLGLPDGGSVTITTDFGPDEISDAHADMLMTMRKDRDISRLAAIKQAKKLGVLPEDYDPDVDFEQLVAEDKDHKPLVPQVPGTFDPSEDKDLDTPNESGDDGPAPRTEDE
jgi:hypothetical protein